MSHLGIEPSLPKEQIKSLLQSHSAINGPYITFPTSESSVARSVGLLHYH